MRDENDAQIAASRREVEKMYTRKMSELQNDAGRWQTQGAQTQSELRQPMKRIDELNSEGTTLTVPVNGNAGLLESLDRQLERERSENQATMSAKEAEICCLKA